MLYNTYKIVLVACYMVGRVYTRRTYSVIQQHTRIGKANVFYLVMFVRVDTG